MTAWMDWSGVIVGVLVLLHVAQGRLSRPRAPGETDPRPAFVTLSSLLLWASLLSLAAYLLTLPTEPPFQPGGLLGKGLVLGAVLVLCSIALLLRWGPPEVPTETEGADRLSAVPAACALLTVNIVFLVWRKTPVEPMLGLCLTTVLYGAILRYGLGALGSVTAGARLPATGGAAERLALLTVTGAAAVALGAEHFPDKPALWSLPIALGAVTLGAAVAAEALGQLVGGDVRRSVTHGAAVAVAAGAAALVAAGAFEQAPAAYSYFTGLVVTGLAVWLLSDAMGGLPTRLRVAAIAGLLAVATYVIAFRFMAGLGAALALQAAWLFTLLAPADDTERNSPSDRYAPLLSLGLLFVLYRLNQQLVPMGRTGDPLAHYSLIAVALGLLAPFLWQAYLLQSRSGVRRLLGSAGAGGEPIVAAVKAVIGHLTALGIAVVGAPAVLYFLWPRYAVGGYLIGLFLAQLVLTLRASERPVGPAREPLTRPSSTGLGLLCAAAMLGAIPVCRLLANAGDTPRLYKAIVAAVVVLALYIWGWMASRQPEDGEEVTFQ